jgi:hypothetical protein
MAIKNNAPPVDIAERRRLADAGMTDPGRESPHEVPSMARPRIKQGHLIALALGFLSCMAPADVLADAPSSSASEGCTRVSLKQLQRLSPCELEQLYAQAEPGPVPCGCTQGRVLTLTDNRLPKVKTRMFNLAWKGKCFEPDGSFINRFPGFQALPSRAEIGASWHDGRPSHVMEYPDGTPLFGNFHDEIREVAPGLYLGRLYERCPESRFLGWIALETIPERCRR